MITIKYNGKTYSNFENIDDLINIGIPEDIILDHLKQDKLTQLKQELQNFIYSHYDQGTQASFSALYQQAKGQNNTDALTQIQKVWDWIQSVLDYYYSKKEAIKNVTNYTELENVTWAWQDVEEAEHVELQDVINMLNQQ